MTDLTESYLFSTIAHKVAAYQAAHPDADIIRLGIGDVTRPHRARCDPRAARRPWTTRAVRRRCHGYGPRAGL